MRSGAWGPSSLAGWSQVPVHERAVPFGLRLRLQHGVDPAQRRRGRQGRAGEGAQRVAGGRTDGGRLGALAADVAEHEGPGLLVQREDVEEVAADLATVARRDVATGELAPRDGRQPRRHHAGLQGGRDPGAVVQDLLEVLLVADPFGHLTEHDERPGRTTRDVGERLLADVEGPLVTACVVGQDEPARADLHDPRGVHQVADPPPDELPTGPARECDGGRVDVDDPLERVEDEDGVGHALDHRAAGQRGQVDEALLEQAPHQQPAGDGERERRQVDESEPADLEVVQDVRRPGQQRRAQQHQGHPTVGPGQPHHAGDEQHRRADEQQVVVGEDRPEHRPRLDVRQLVRAGCRGVGAHQVVRGRHREDCQRSRPAGSPAAPPGDG